jgi:predicted nucleic acid-binding protein
MILVVDAGVACKWFATEVGSDAAEVLLSAGHSLLAPDLIVPEVCDIAWLKLRRGEVTAAQAAAMVENLPGMFDALLPGASLAPRALEIAARLGHPAYACFYLALAERRDTRLVTADRRLVAALGGTEWARLAVGLGDDPAAP